MWVPARLFPGAHVGKGAVVDRVMLAQNTVIDANAIVGSDETPTVVIPQNKLCSGGITLVAENVRIGSGAVIGRNVVVSESIA